MKNYLEVIEECRKAHEVYLELRQKVSSYMIQCTDGKSWTESLYTDGFNICLTKTGDYLTVYAFFEAHNEKSSIGLEEFLCLCEAEKKKGAMLSKNEISEIRKKFVTQTF